MNMTLPENYRKKNNKMEDLELQVQGQCFVDYLYYYNALAHGPVVSLQGTFSGLCRPD